jgi:hypothetical protein
MSVQINNQVNTVTLSDTISTINTTDTVSVVQVSGGIGPQGPAGTGGAKGYYGSFHDETDQYVSAINTPTTIVLSHTDEANGTYIDAGSHIHFENAGTYDIQFSAQFLYAASESAELVADIWIRLNGVNVTESTGRVTLSVNNLYTIASWDYLVSVNAGDYVEFMWSTTNTNIVLTREEANATHPAVPSMAVTVIQVMYTQLGPTGPTGSAGIVFQPSTPLDTTVLWVDTDDTTSAEAIGGSSLSGNIDGGTVASIYGGVTNLDFGGVS